MTDLSSFPTMLSSVERQVLQRKIESLIERLHPDGIEALEILAALTAAVKTRYENKYMAISDVEYFHEKLATAYENAYESMEGASEADIKEMLADFSRRNA